MIRQGIFGNEDCLYLNVYTPSIEKNANKPVIVYIVPGGFNAGSGDDDVYGPDFLVEQDVILVTFNSRLGAHGENFSSKFDILFFIVLAFFKAS